jgi:hypothetical protein
MSINSWDPEYQASVDRARGDLIAFRLRHGLNPDPEAPVATVHPRALIAIMPLRVRVTPETIDRTATIQTAIDELIEIGIRTNGLRLAFALIDRGFTTVELRQALDAVDAANEGDTY